MLPVNRIVATIITPILATLGVLVVSVTPALASTPETPETVSPATGITAKTATLHGVLNPKATVKGEPGSYQFSYEPSATECGAPSAPGILAPASPVFATGEKAEKVEVGLTNLEPNKEYAFCVVAYSLSGVTEPAYGAAVPFKTAAQPPEIASESTSGITSTGATLEAQINPNNEPTSYTFEYSTTEHLGALTGTPIKVKDTSPANGYPDQTASAPSGVLLPGTTYYYRVVAENKKSEEESKPVVFPAGSVQSFTTAPEAPETIKPATSITATTAVLEGVVNPKVGATVGWYFAYSNPGGASCLEGPTTEPHETEAARDKAHVSKEVTGLQPGKKYEFCLVAANAAGAQTTAGNEETFETKLAPPSIEPGSETASGVTPYEATLEAQVNPNNEVTTYSFEYSTSNTLAGAITLTGNRTLGGYGAQTASVSTGHVLTPGKTYYYRAIARNATGTTTDPAIEHFTTPTPVAPMIESQSDTVQSPFAANLEATVNPEYQASTCVFEYGTVEAKVAAGEGTPVPCNPASLGEGGGGVGATASLTGLSSATKYYFRVSATNGSGTTTDTTIEKLETPIAEAPVFDSERSLFVTAFTAELEAVITPNFQTTTCELQYGTEKAKVATGGGTVVPCAPAQFGPTGKNENTDISLTGLQQGTTYYYRVVATNATGTTVAPTIAEFATPLAPAVTPGEAQSVTSSTAIFTGGSVNPEGAETRYRIAYVAAAEYEPGAANPYAKGRSTPEVNAGAELTPQAVASAQVSELASGTTYHYAIIATSPAGTTIGADQTFTTGPAASQPPSAEQIPTGPAPLPASPFTNTPTPAFIPYTSIAVLDATEAHENKGTGTTKKTKKSKKKKKKSKKHKKNEQHKKK